MTMEMKKRKLQGVFVDSRTIQACHRLVGTPSVALLQPLGRSTRHPRTCPQTHRTCCPTMLAACSSSAIIAKSGSTEGVWGSWTRQ